MAKATLATLSINTQYTGVSALNSNFQAISTALDKTLSRDGTAPNAMEATLDMNSNRIINLIEPVADHEPARKIDLDELRSLVEDSSSGGGSIPSSAIPALAVSLGLVPTFTNWTQPTTLTLIPGTPTVIIPSGTIAPTGGLTIQNTSFSPVRLSGNTELASSSHGLVLPPLSIVNFLPGEVTTASISAYASAAVTLAIGYNYGQGLGSGTFLSPFEWDHEDVDITGGVSSTVFAGGVCHSSLGIFNINPVEDVYVTVSNQNAALDSGFLVTPGAALIFDAFEIPSGDVRVWAANNCTIHLTRL